MGTRITPAPKPNPCPWCHGLKVETVVRDGKTEQITCQQCNGTGHK